MFHLTIQVIEIKRDPTGDEKHMRATIRKSTLRSTLRKGQAPDTADIHTKIRKLADENLKFKEQLEKASLQLFVLCNFRRAGIWSVT